MKKPVSTYRVQLNSNFDLGQLKDILPYLSKLGISHIYASPIFQARKESSHGYDIVDSNKISGQLGGLSAFEEVSKECKALELGWIQDIVPNHVSYSMENDSVLDLMKKGNASKFRDFLDVDWNHPSRLLKGKIMAPFLEKSYKECLRQGEFQIVYGVDGLALRHNGTDFPLIEETRQEILGNNGKSLKTTLENELKKVNRNPALLDELISKQVFVLTYWKTALKQINYRRFFDIMDLICLQMEKVGVFEEVHKLTFDFLNQGKFSGIRVDHIDGLHNPEEYIERVREKAPDAFVVIEKILMGQEKLPPQWRVQGTTGYDFLNYVNKLFVDTLNQTEFDQSYKQFTGNFESFSELLYDCKKQVVEGYFGGDVANLCRLVLKALRNTSHSSSAVGNKRVRKEGRNVKEDKRAIYSALVELLASFPVYRTYISEKNTGPDAQEYLVAALKLAMERRPNLKRELVAIEKLLRDTTASKDALATVMRLQQFTGVFMAKGFEDTALYRYNRLLSLNDVGSDPSKFGCLKEEFHSFNVERQRNWPFSMNSTSTHDTKRGEDVRARLNVLSELPEEFKEHIEKWTEINAVFKKKIRGKVAPDRNEEWYIYQTILGAYPFVIEERANFVDRMKGHLTKMLREAKVHSNWLSPNLKYEETVNEFCSRILDSTQEKEFQKDFFVFQKKIAKFGILNSLAQTLFKVTSPGVPDFYQGSELWDLNLVDPDNRRPVDFDKRKKLLEEVAETNITKHLEFPKKPEDGKVKLYEIYESLQIRKSHRELFEEGNYIPLEVEGTHKRNVVAFCRNRKESYALIVVPRFSTRLNVSKDGITEFDWKDTRIFLPKNAPRDWRNVFTKDCLVSQSAEGNSRLHVAELFGCFPVALLLSGERR